MDRVIEGARVRTFAESAAGAGGASGPTDPGKIPFTSWDTK
jgi:hypothetical protein